MGVLRHLTNQMHGGGSGGGGGVMWYPTKDISLESLVIGALEAAFWETDQLIGDDKKRYKMQGGCTVLVSVFILGKLYVANAGDSRAVLCRDKAAYPMSFDFTPTTERQRLQHLGYLKPHLLGNEYTHLDYCRRPLRKDLGKSMLYRDAHMTGWAYKEIQQEDLKFPLVYGEGKRSRLLATIGVTRGFGDHDLRAQSSTSNPVYIKPFLTPQPEVRVLDVETEDITDSDVLVMATDGLWDVMANERVADIVNNGLTSKALTAGGGSGSGSAAKKKVINFSDDEMDQEDVEAKAKQEAELKKKYRHITIAQDLVMAARGKLIDRNWKRTVKPMNNNTSQQSSQLSNGSAASAAAAAVAVEVLPATIDDISVFVIPILSYKHEYLAWKAEKLAKSQQAPNEAPQPATDFDINKFEAEMDRVQFGGESEAGNDDSRTSQKEGSVEKGVEALADQESGEADPSSQEAVLAGKPTTDMEDEDEDTVDH